MAKKWKTVGKPDYKGSKLEDEAIIHLLLKNRGLTTTKEIEAFLQPKDPDTLSAKDVDIDKKSLDRAVKRMQKAINNKESIVVYADYDADGITAGAIMWETLHGLGAEVMPYIPHRVDEGYGLSQKGIDAVREQYHPTLIITVDHGITAHEKIAYAKSLGIDVIVTDHHVKPQKLPDCTIVHTTTLCGAGVSWFVARELLSKYETPEKRNDELIALAAIGTIADLVPLIGANRCIVKFGLVSLNKTKRVGLDALISEAGLTKGQLGTFDISHVLAPRLNAMGRLVHAMDALRLLCTHREDKAMLLARTLGLTNKERQQLTMDMSAHAKDIVKQRNKTGEMKKLLFVAHESYNQGVIGLVAGKLVEEFYRPAIVLALGETVSKASARSIPGFNIVEAIRANSDILVDVGGHPMAAGFTVETQNIAELQKRLETFADKALDDENLKRSLRIDCEIPFTTATEALWQAMRDFEPFGFGNPEPMFVSRGVIVDDARLIGKDNRHLKLRLVSANSDRTIEAVAFGMGELYAHLRPDKPIDVAYTIDMNVWNGTSRLQLKIKDIQVP